MIDYFFEIPVYSMTEETYNRRMEAIIEREKGKYNLQDDNPNYELALRAIHEANYRDWQYNQIIGFLKLYCNRNKTRIYADYYEIDKKRIPFKLDKKYFKYRVCYPEWNIDLSNLKTSKEIFNKLVEELPGDMTGFFKGFYLNLYFLKKVGPYIDWIRLLEIRR